MESAIGNPKSLLHSSTTLLTVPEETSNNSAISSRVPLNPFSYDLISCILRNSKRQLVNNNVRSDKKVSSNASNASL